MVAISNSADHPTNSGTVFLNSRITGSSWNTKVTLCIVRHRGDVYDS